MKKLLATLLFVFSASAFSQQQCYDKGVVDNVVHIMFTQVATIDQKQAEIDALKKFITDNGLVYTSGFDRFVQQLQELQHLLS